MKGLVLARFAAVVVTLGLAGCASPDGSGDEAVPAAAAGPTAESEQTATGRLGSHNMLLAGTADEAFLTHVPLFMAPHDIQVIVAGRFVRDGGAETAASAAPAPDGELPTSFADKLFTFLPAPYSLDALRGGTLQELRGTIFLGNSESGGRPVGEGFRFRVTKIIHQHVLDKTTPAQPELSYFVFGSKERTFAVHQLSGAPGFDELLRVRLGGEQPPTDDELAEGIAIRVPNLKDATADRLGKRSGATTVKAGTRTFTLEAQTTLSCLTGPDFFASCP